MLLGLVYARRKKNVKKEQKQGEKGKKRQIEKFFLFIRHSIYFLTWKYYNIYENIYKYI